MNLDGRKAILTLNQFSGSAHNAKRAASGLEKGVSRLGYAFGGIGAYLSVRQLMEYADTWNLIQARVRLVTTSHEEARAVQTRLYDIAQRTRNTMAATAVLYHRLAMGANELGRSQEEFLLVTESVNAGLLVSGATGVEAAQSMRQLAQAFSKGKLDGDEFRTVMEAMPTVAQAIADQLGVTRNALLELAPAGKISANAIIQALIDANEGLKKQVAEIPLTFGQAWIVLQNAAEKYIGIFSLMIRSSQHLSGAIKFITDNMTTLMSVIAGVAAGYMTYRLALIGIVGMYQLLLIVSGKYAIQQAFITGAQTIRAFIQLARTIRTAADATALLGMVSMGVVGAIGAILGLIGGFIVYRKIVASMTKETEKWNNAQADLSKKIGTYTPPKEKGGEKAAKDAEQARHETEDMIRLARQGLALAYLAEREREREQIRLDAINKTIQVRRELEGELLQNRLKAIALERDLRLEAEEVSFAREEAARRLQEELEILERFAENFQRNMGDVFYKILNDGLKTFSDLFSAIKQMFLRMLADMLAAQMMKSLGKEFSNILARVFNKMPMPATNGQPTTTDTRTGQTEAEVAAIIRSGNKDQAIQLPPLAVEAKVQRNILQFAAKMIGAAFAGAGVGQMVGNTTSNSALGFLGGAAGGAAAGFAMGGVPGAVVGGLTGAITGLMGASEKHRQELEKHRAIVRENSRVLTKLRDTVYGSSRTGLAQAAVFAEKNPVSADIIRAMANPFQRPGVTFLQDWRNVSEVAKELGITLDGTQKTWDQFREAVNLAVIAVTQFGRNLTDIKSKQEAYNKIFGVPDTPQQRQQDSYSLLTQMAPELLKAVGLGNLNLDSPYAQEALKQGFKDIYNLIQSGGLTPEMLGAFADKNQLLSAIMDIIDAFGELEKEILKVTTDFPRAMDIIYYENKFGRYGEPALTPTTPTAGIVVQGDIIIENNGNESGEEILDKVERAALKRGARGGFVSMPVRATT